MTLDQKKKKNSSHPLSAWDEASVCVCVYVCVCIALRESKLSIVPNAPSPSP